MEDTLGGICLVRQSTRTTGVLILVLVEDTLGDGLKNGMENCQPCLNPCFNGIIGGKMMLRCFLSQKVKDRECSKGEKFSQHLGCLMLGKEGS